MRIRKRKVPLPFSLLSPVPISDPHLFTRSPATLHHHPPPPNPPSTTPAQPPPPSDHPDLPPLIVGGDGTPATRTDIQEHLYCLGERNHEEKNGDGSNSFTGAPTTTTGAVAVAPNDNNNNNNNNNGLGLLVSNHQEDEKGCWSDRDRVVPLKKRRSSCFEESSSSSQQPSPNSTIMKSKTNKLCFEFGHDESSKPGEQVKKHDLDFNLNHETSNNVVGGGGGGSDNSNNNNDNNNGGGGGGKTMMRGSGKRGNTIMEGSRCSRVNGRGWRCCQPTLVGYSLCEHHLGKGRLRSMSAGGGAASASAGRGRPGLNSSKKVVLGQSSSLALPSPPPAKPAEDDDDDEDEVEIKPVMSTVNSLGKRVKLGVVKARSLSSLLGQTQTQTTQTRSDSNNNSDGAKATATMEVVVQGTSNQGSSSHGGLV